MDFEVVPQVGVGELRFTMNRTDARVIMGKPERIIQWTPQSEEMTDVYDSLGVTIHYNRDYLITVVEFTGPTSPTYAGEKLLDIKDPGTWLENLDPEAETDPPDLSSDKLSIAYYISPTGDRSVGIFCPGYYDLINEEDSDE